MKDTKQLSHVWVNSGYIDKLDIDEVWSFTLDDTPLGFATFLNLEHMVSFFTRSGSNLKIPEISHLTHTVARGKVTMNIFRILIQHGIDLSDDALRYSEKAAIFFHLCAKYGNLLAAESAVEEIKKIRP